MALHMKKLAMLSLITSLAPAVGFSQSCTVAQVSQEFSYEDTFNSSGSALGDAYAVFQQDRFYVNQQERLDPNDKPDPIMVNREARANYGQAIRAYMSANGMDDMPAQVLVGSQYTVEIEACGSQDNPSIRVLSMRMGGDIEDDSWELELEYREAELAEWELEREYREAELADWEQRLNQREADLNQWERQLGDWERRLSDWEFRLTESQDELNGSGPVASVDGKDDQEVPETAFDRFQSMFMNDEITDAASLGDCIMLSVGIARSDEQNISYEDAAAYLQQINFRSDVDSMTGLIIDAVDASDNIDETSGMIMAILAEPWGGLYAAAAGVCVNGYHLSTSQ